MKKIYLALILVCLVAVTGFSQEVPIPRRTRRFSSRTPPPSPDSHLSCSWQSCVGANCGFMMLGTSEVMVFLVDPVSLCTSISPVRRDLCTSASD